MSSNVNNAERQRVVAQALDATTLAEIEAATQALDAWLAEHPEDIGLEDGYEQLALMKDAVLTVEAGKTEPIATL